MYLQRSILPKQQNEKQKQEPNFYELKDAYIEENQKVKIKLKLKQERQLK